MLDTHKPLSRRAAAKTLTMMAMVGAGSRLATANRKTPINAATSPRTNALMQAGGERL